MVLCCTRTYSWPAMAEAYEYPFPARTGTTLTEAAHHVVWQSRYPPLTVFSFPAHAYGQLNWWDWYTKLPFDYVFFRGSIRRRKPYPIGTALDGGEQLPTSLNPSQYVLGQDEAERAFMLIRKWLRCSCKAPWTRSILPPLPIDLLMTGFGGQWFSIRHCPYCVSSEIAIFFRAA